eukprot:6462747-Amphidinium_carterae.1
MSEQYKREGHQFWALLDTGAQSACMGTRRWTTLQEKLRERGLQAIPVSATIRSAKGIGGTSRTLGSFNIPMALGGICGVVTVTIVDEPEIPHLLPVGLMQGLGLVLSLPKLLCRWTQCKPVAKSDIYQMGLGHLAVDILEFPKSGWRFPTRLSLHDAHKAERGSTTRLYHERDWFSPTGCSRSCHCQSVVQRGNSNVAKTERSGYSPGENKNQQASICCHSGHSTLEVGSNRARGPPSVANPSGHTSLVLASEGISATVVDGHGAGEHANTAKLAGSASAFAGTLSGDRNRDDECSPQSQHRCTSTPGSKHMSTSNGFTEAKGKFQTAVVDMHPLRKQMVEGAVQQKCTQWHQQDGVWKVQGSNLPRDTGELPVVDATGGKKLSGGLSSPHATFCAVAHDAGSVSRGPLVEDHLGGEGGCDTGAGNSSGSTGLHVKQTATVEHPTPDSRTCIPTPSSGISNCHGCGEPGKFRECGTCSDHATPPVSDVFMQQSELPKVDRALVQQLSIGVQKLHTRRARVAKLGIDDSKPWTKSLGLYTSQGGMGLTRGTKDEGKGILRLVRKVLKDYPFAFTTVTINLMSEGMSVPGHKDARNAEGHDNLVLPWGDFKGGELWWIDAKGKKHVHCQRSAWCRFDPHCEHGVSNVEHGLRWSLILSTSGRLSCVPMHLWRDLWQCGFPRHDSLVQKHQKCMWHTCEAGVMVLWTEKHVSDQVVEFLASAGYSLQLESEHWKGWTECQGDW